MGINEELRVFAAYGYFSGWSIKSFSQVFISGGKMEPQGDCEKDSLKVIKRIRVSKKLCFMVAGCNWERGKDKKNGMAAFNGEANP